MEPRRWWPNYLFHCTDIRNVVSILKSGELLSRVQVDKADCLAVDIAGPAIIAQTDPEVARSCTAVLPPQDPDTIQ